MNFFKTALLIAILTALFMGVGYAIGGSNGALIALVIAGAMNLLAYWNSDTLVLKMSNATSADSVIYKEFYTIVEKLVINAKLPMPKLYIIHDSTPNAFATGRNPKNAAVAITEGIWALLSKEELAGVIAHELAHIRNRDTLISTITATFAGAISMLANMFMFMSIFGGNRHRENPVVGLLVMLLAPISAAIIQMAVSRQREYAADKLGGQICENPLYLASALQKLENYKQGMQGTKLVPAVAHMFIINPFTKANDSLFATHPHTANRIQALLVQAEKMGVTFTPISAMPKASVQKIYSDAHLPNNPWI